MTRVYYTSLVAVQCCGFRRHWEGLYHHPTVQGAGGEATMGLSPPDTLILPWLLTHTENRTSALLEDLLDRMGRDWCLRQVSKSNFGVVWSWRLTALPPKLIVSSSWPVDDLWQFAAKSIRSSSKYRVHKIGNRRTDGQTDRRTDGQVENVRPSSSLNWRRHKTC